MVGAEIGGHSSRMLLAKTKNGAAPLVPGDLVQPGILQIERKRYSKDAEAKRGAMKTRGLSFKDVAAPRTLSGSIRCSIFVGVVRKKQRRRRQHRAAKVEA